jgi:hypothetical protein
MGEPIQPHQLRLCRGDGPSGGAGRAAAGRPPSTVIITHLRIYAAQQADREGQAASDMSPPTVWTITSSSFRDFFG